MSRSRTKNDESVYAFLLQTNPSESISVGIKHDVVTDVPNSEIARQIQENLQTTTPVEMILPKDWSPPTIANSSQDAILAGWDKINAQVRKYLRKKTSMKPTTEGLSETAMILIRPASGRVFFFWRF